MDLKEYPVIAEFTAFVRRPKPLASGVKAQLFGQNGDDADAVMGLAKSSWQDALVHVALDFDGDDGGFEGYVRRPEPSVSGMVAVFFGENGSDADMITALGLSKYLDRRAHVCVRLVQDPDGSESRAKPKGPHSHDAQSLWRSSFFRTPTVWAAVGTDDDFLSWIRRQRCCINVKDYGPHNGDIVPMHVRRIANGAGEAHKPRYSAVPGCDQHHRMQHQSGESAVGGKEAFDAKRMQHVQRWAWETVVAALGFSSMTHVPPIALYRWAAERDLEKRLPLEYSLASFERTGS